MNGTVIIPGPELVILWGINVPMLSAIFGIVGVLLGHLVAPVPAEPLGWRRHCAIVAGGMLLSLALTISTGQRPLLVLGWSIGIGFSGLALFVTLGSQVVSGANRLFEAIVEMMAARIAARKDDK